MIPELDSSQLSLSERRAQALPRAHEAHGARLLKGWRGLVTTPSTRKRFRFTVLLVASDKLQEWVPSLALPSNGLYCVIYDPGVSCNK
jgi:hypothetical protein